ncbi:MAG: PIG-L family deacetylase [Pirellulales bacterium]
MPSVLAIAAHPDDIEFVMSGTMFRLAELGWETHYFNIANGCCGSMTLDRAACARVRLDEARRAAEILGARFYSPICDDLSIFYTPELIAKTAAVVRAARPHIVLTHAPIDYMEDHQNASRLAVTAAFIRGMPNCVTDPQQPVVSHDVAVYHAQPHGNRLPLGEPVTPTHCVDVTPVMDRKAEMLLAHQSQSGWLDETQGLSSYVQTMRDLNAEVGRLGGGAFEFAEGWRKHIHLGFSSREIDPLAEALGTACLVAKR